MTSVSYHNFLYTFCILIFIVGGMLALFHSANDAAVYLPNQEILEQNDATSEWLNKQERQIWDHIYSTTNINKQECQRLKEQRRYEYNGFEEQLHKEETSTTPLSYKTRKIVTKIIQDFGLRSHEISLLSWNVDSYAAATDSALLINEKLFAPLPLCVKKFLIGHELQHLIYKDTSTRYILDESYQSSDTLPKNHPIMKLFRFQEIRADIQSAVKSAEYKEGYRMFIEILAQEGENEGITHPKHSVRLSMANKLITQEESVIAT
jgi:hypothetical protein